MIQKHKKLIVISILICLIPIVAGALFFNSAPDQIPTHFDANGIADVYQDKAAALFRMPIVVLILHISTIFVFSKPKNIEGQSEDTIKLLLFIFPIISLGVSALNYLNLFNVRLNLLSVALIMISLFFFVFGFFMPRVDKDFSFALKFPWIYNDPQNWKVTHILAAFTMIAGGASGVYLAYIGRNGMVALVLLAAALIPMIFSYIFYLIKDKGF